MYVYMYVKYKQLQNYTGAYAGGGALGARAPPLTWEKDSLRNVQKIERKFRPDMSAKKNVHVPLGYDKIKTKKVGKKEEKSKRKAEGLAQWLRSLPPNPEVPGSIPGLVEG